MPRWITHLIDGGVPGQHHYFTVTDDYTVTDQLGIGAYGCVCAAKHTQSGELVAIKQVGLDRSARSAVKLLREIKALSFFNHPNIVKLYDIVELRTPDFHEVSFVIDFMDFDLDVVIRNQGNLSTDHIKHFLYQTLCGVKCIHSAAMIHRDLKPKNILVNHACDVKICDFGLARELSDDMSQYVETRWYRAPEIIMDWRKYDYKVDIWSIGCVLGEMLVRQPLWPGKNSLDQLKMILRTLGAPVASEIEGIGSLKAREYCLEEGAKFGRHGTFDKQFGMYNSEAIQLLRRLLAFSPRLRPTAEEALQDPFFTEVRDEDDEPVCSKPFDLELDANMNDRMEDYNSVRQLLWQEMLRFHPNAGQEGQQCEVVDATTMLPTVAGGLNANATAPPAPPAADPDGSEANGNGNVPT